MITRFQELGRAATVVVIFIFFPLALSASAQTPENAHELPFYIAVKKTEFEKKVRSGLTQVLTRYHSTLEALSNRPFPKESAQGVLELKKEKEAIAKWIPEIEKTDPFEFLTERIGNLNREIIKKQAFLAESTWKMSDGRVLYLKRNGRVYFDDKLYRDTGWEPGADDTFVWGARHWRSQLRDSRSRFTAVDRAKPNAKQVVQAVFIDSNEYNGGPVPLMCREYGKAKLQLAAGLKILIEQYAADLEKTKKADLKGAALDLDEALAAKKEREALVRSAEFLFGSEIRLTKSPNSALTAEELHEKLIGATLKCEDGRSYLLRAKGAAAIKYRNGSISGGNGWEVLDDRTILFGVFYHRIQFDPSLETFQSLSRINGEKNRGVVTLSPKP